MFQGVDNNEETINIYFLTNKIELICTRIIILVVWPWSLDDIAVLGPESTHGYGSFSPDLC